jgi:DNA-binding NarL/FixJ family response regulator
MKAAIALVDDHVLLRNGLASLLTDLRYSVVFEAGHGGEMMQRITAGLLPQVVLMDINMPVMNGFEATHWLKQHHPSVKVLALSMLDDEASILTMIRNGAKGYVLKDCEPDELETAINAVLHKGFYHSEMVSGKLIQALSNGDDSSQQQALKPQLSEKEREFLQWICTDYSYKEIADKMNLSPRTIDGYRDTLYEKLEVRSRVGLALFAIRQGIVNLS